MSANIIFIEILMSRKAKEVSEISLGSRSVHFSAPPLSHHPLEETLTASAEEFYYNFLL